MEENKKYRLTDQSMLYNGKMIYRIEALKDFNDVKKGEYGGFVESEDNLSQDGNCWVYGNAKLFDESVVKDNACVYYNAWVSDNACVSGKARVY